ncbi:MAG TPA: hypothetical protein VH008_07505 [Pseudonocardia sp.]|jgi:xanthine/uracil/vitamin C permease (AzgA family)|nr:hypothetical protein [Pseudonocardia sp.]
MVAAATALVAGVLTILMGVFANSPLALAAGLALIGIVGATVLAVIIEADVGVAALFVVYFALDPVEQLLGVR